MNVIGKVFLFAVFIMSLMLMTLAGAIYVSHVNWKDEVLRTPEECGLDQQPGYKHRLEDAQKERDRLEGQITHLQQAVAESERSRDQVLAKLQSAIIQKNEELLSLRADKEAREQDQREKVALLEKTTQDLEQARDQVEALSKQVTEQQSKVDAQVGR